MAFYDVMMVEYEELAEYINRCEYERQKKDEQGKGKLRIPIEGLQ